MLIPFHTKHVIHKYLMAELAMFICYSLLGIQTRLILDREHLSQTGLINTTKVLEPQEQQILGIDLGALCHTLEAWYTWTGIKARLWKETEKAT